MISIVTPSRGRPDSTRRFIQAAYDNASDPKNVEMIFRFDDCDPELEDIKKMIASLKYPNLRYGVGSRMWGYSSLHEMINEMCGMLNEKSVGVMAGGNDMRITSKNWDLEYERIIEANPISVVHIKINKDNGKGIQFPVMSKTLHGILGHYSLHPSIDGYVTFIGLRSRCLFYSEVEVEHDHMEGDAVFTDRIESDKEKQHTFWAKETQTIIIDDARRVNHVLGEMELVNFYKKEEK